MPLRRTFLPVHAPALMWQMRVLKKVDGISFCELTSKDVVRHPLVQKIVQAYDEYEKKAKPENRSGRAKSTTRKRRENK